MTLEEVVYQHLQQHITANSELTDMYAKVREKTDKPLIELVMKRTGGNQVHAAKILGINRNTLRSLLTKYNIEVVRARSAI